MRNEADDARAAHRVRVSAAVGFWAVAVLFVTDVALLQGWIDAPAGAAVVDPEPSVTPAPSPTATGPSVVTVRGAQAAFPLPATFSSRPLEVAGEPATLLLHTATRDDATTFNLGVVEYPDVVDLSDPAVNLLASVSGAAGSIGGRIIDQKVTLFEGEPAVTYRIETPSTRLAGRNVIVRRRLYSQSVAYRGVNDPEGAKAFFDSFRLTGE